MSIWATPERRELRKSVRTFAEREILPHIDEWERIGELPRDLSRAAAAADVAIICEELHEAGTPGGVFASLFTVGIAVPHMIASGDQWLIDKFVKPANQAVQLFGGMGYMAESEVERQYRDMRILGIGGGTTEIMTSMAAKTLGYRA